jgi:Fibronectin type III domain
VPFTAAQKAGDLNVVIVGWSDSITHLTGLGDSKGNTYRVAVGPTVLGGTHGLWQMVVYASNIAAASPGANAVTLTFNTAATYPDVRILEYSGISLSNPLDKAVASTGNSATSDSGAITTTNARDLLVGTNVVWTGTTGPGSGFTKRLLSNPDGDIVEDRVVTVTGSYRATAPLSSAGPWIMQMAAFRAASSTSAATPTPKPSPTPTPNPAGTPTKLVSVTLAWNANAPTSDPKTNASGYRVRWGTTSGTYTQIKDAGKKTTATVSTLISGTRYYFVVTAYNSAGVDSLPSNQFSYTAPK